jgi:outer membrane protein OmpA-like peptidoglycan-associated protein
MMRRRYRLHLLGLILACTTISILPVHLSAEESDRAGALAPSFWRSEYLGATGGTFADRQGDPLGLFFLPHAGARTQIPMVSGSGGVTLDGSAGGGSLGVLFPVQRGVWGAATGLYSDNSGTLWRGDIGAGRPLGHRVTGGASVTVQTGTDGNDSDFGMGLNLSGSFRPDLGRFSGVSLHGGMRNIGKGVRLDPDGEAPFPGFTPFGGLHVAVVSTETVSIDLSAAVSLESFQRARLDGSVVSRFSGGVWGVLGWNHRFGSGESGVWPGLSIGIGVPLGNRGNRNTDGTRVHLSGQPDRRGRLNISGGFRTPLPGSDSLPPEVEMAVLSPEDFRDDLAGTVFLSPQPETRELLVDLHMRDDSSVGELSGTLFGPDGKVVREWSFSPRGTNIPRGTISERLSSSLYSTGLSGRILWTSDMAEKDGFYRLEVTGKDGSGNGAVPVYLDVLVDTRSPDLNILETAVQRDGEVVSVSGPEDEHLLRLNHTFLTLFEVRDAEKISAFLIDEAGRKLFPLEVDVLGGANEEGFLTGQVLWNGGAPEGARVNNGAYRVSIEASDFLDNRSAVVSDTVVVQQEVPEFRVALSDGRVAPNGDGNRDSVAVRTSLSPVEGLREWNIRVTEKNSGEITGEWSGIDLPPGEIVLGRDVFPRDGVYVITGRSVYDNGTEASVTAGEIVSDRMPPAVELALSRQTVRPEQGRDVEIYFEGGNGVGRVDLRVESVGRSEGSEGFTLAQLDRLPDTFTWSLTGPDEELLPPGMYRIRAEAVDETGNRGVSQYRDVVLVERLGGVGIVPLRRLFGPTGNGSRDSAPLLLEGPDDSDGEFVVTIENSSAETIRTFRGSLPLPERIVWDGRNDRGVVVSDGRYRPSLFVTVSDVDTLESAGEWITVDTTPPAASVALTGPRVLSPDGDGIQDELRFSLNIESEDRWDRLDHRFLLVRRDSEDPGAPGTSVASAVPDLVPGENVWVPRSADGTVLPDGRYAVVVELEDQAGNLERFVSDGFLIDTRPVTAFVRVNRGAVNPTGEAPLDRVTVTPVVSDRAGLVEWQVRIIDDNRGVSVLEIEGDGETPPEPFQWPGDGSTDGDADQPADGTYYARFEARYHHGPRLLRESPRFRVDTTGPDVSVSVDPQPFSPDGDGVDDIVSFRLVAEDPSPIRYWYLEVYDPRGAFFYDQGGDGPPPDVIRWDGRARNGETVLSAEEYPWRLEIADSLGNVQFTEGVLAVDILVEPYEGGYRIQVPSITFPPNSAELMLDGDDEVARKNRDVLDRVAEILSRYPEYSVTVEGHAVNLSGTQREESEELQPLSRMRAEAVRQALVRRGVSSGMLSARGRGGTLPVVPHDDEQMRWKNRRVDFILQR